MAQQVVTVDVAVTAVVVAAVAVVGQLMDWDPVAAADRVEPAAWQAAADMLDLAAMAAV